MASPATSALLPALPLASWFRQELLDNLVVHRGVGPAFATTNDWYHALGLALRHLLMSRWLDSIEAQLGSEAKFVCYLSAEYLLGRQLDNNLLAAGVEDVVRDVLAELGQDLDELRRLEVEPGLGNGGLGRLAACFLDSLAHLGIAAVGYGIRYEYGIFRQDFDDGRQVERPDQWLLLGSPWEFPHPEMAVRIGFGGRVDVGTNADGELTFTWVPHRTVLAVPYNMMVPGYGDRTVNTLRLWSARSTEGFDLEIFNAGDYTQAVHDKVVSENISKVLYPEDATPQGRQLRLEQQYFFTAASLRDIVRMLGPDFDLRSLPDRVSIQLNDTHPAIAVAELMRVLVDEHDLPWDAAWDVTRQTCSYTCHTLLPEALEVWPVELFGALLPRHLQIIEEINRRFCDEVRARFPRDEERVRRMTILTSGPEASVRMAHLATVGSQKINGVAELHSKLLRETVLRDFAEMWPERFTNITNGVTPRRFVRLANPRLSSLITEALGSDAWIGDLEQLRGLEHYAGDAGFRDAWRQVKRANKDTLAAEVLERTGVAIDPSAMFDVMVKRLHEYKRQLLKLLHVVYLHDKLLSDPSADVAPRVVYFGAKAAPGYYMAKEIIRLINAVGDTINADPAMAGRLAVVFPPNYNVTAAERIMPAADLSEQISLAGKEASGTGNMKLALNGAVTIGTLDGANVEIRELVGAEHFFLFGLTEAEVGAVRGAGYRPRSHYERDHGLRAVIDRLASGAYTRGDRPYAVVESLLDHDPFLVLADYQSYLAAQTEVERAWADPERWTVMSILNVARSGWFSSDRSIRDYLRRVWHAEPVDVVAWKAAHPG